jgi:tetratricopeptide (TPR) repeat protein
MAAIARKFAVWSFLLCVFAAPFVSQTAARPQSLAGPALASADAAMQAGRYADAAAAYETWLKTRPNAKEVLLALGICYMQLGRQDEAVTTLRRYLKLVPRSAAGHAALGIALLDGAKTAQAKAELQTAVRLNPRQVDAVESLARVYLIEGKAVKAAALLRPIASSKASDDTLALLGDALIKTGQARAAGDLLERRLQSNPHSSSQIYARAAWAHFKAGDLSRCAEVCERGMRIYPDSEIAAVYLSLPAPTLAERIGARIERIQNAPDADEMVAVGRALIDADPMRKTRANEIAQRLLAHAIQLAPSSASAHYNYGRALIQSSPARAIEEWEKALTFNPDGALRLQILNKIGAAKLDLSDFEGTEQAFKEAQEINRKLTRRDPEATLEYVRFLQLRSRPEEAETLLQETLSWNPFSPQARLELAKLLAARGQWNKVVEEGEFVLRNAEEDEELLRSAHLLLARAYYRLNQPEKAQRSRSWLESR